MQIWAMITSKEITSKHVKEISLKKMSRKCQIIWFKSSVIWIAECFIFFLGRWLTETFNGAVNPRTVCNCSLRTDCYQPNRIKGKTAWIQMWCEIFSANSTEYTMVRQEWYLMQAQGALTHTQMNEDNSPIYTEWGEKKKHTLVPRNPFKCEHTSH